MITATNLSKNFLDSDNCRVDALKGVSFHVSKGEVVGIIGPSGAGTSILLRCMAGLENPSGGEIKRASGIRIGMVFQKFNLFAHLPVLENVTLAPIKLLGMSREEAENLAMSVLRRVGMAEHAGRMPSTLSGGQQQRAAIARTLAMKPDVLLMDEPTSSLDPTMVDEVQGVVGSLAQEGMTMVIVTHEMRFANGVAGRILLEEGSPEQIFENPSMPQTRAFVQRIRRLEFDISSGDFDFYDMRSQIKRFCIRCSIAEKMGEVTHVVDEMLSLISDYRNTVYIEVSHSDLKQETTVTVLQRGAEVSALDNPDADELAVMIIRGMSKSAKTEQTPDGVKTIFEI